MHTCTSMKKHAIIFVIIRLYHGLLLERCWIILGRAWASSKLHLKYPHWHAAICPGGLLWLHRHGLSFTVKPWAPAVMPSTYLKPAYILLPVTRSLPCHAIIRLTIVQKVSCRACCHHIQVESSLLSLSFMPTLQFGSSPSCSFSQLSWSTHRCGHCELFKIFEVKLSVIRHFGSALVARFWQGEAP